MPIRNHLLLFAACVLVGCSDSTSPGDIAVTITPSASIMRAGDTLHLNVIVANVGDRAYVLTSAGCPRPFRVYDPAGEIVAIQDICSLAGLSRTLEPGDSHTYHFTWTGENVGPNGARSPLPAGPYGLRGYVGVADLGIIEAGGTNVYILPPE